MSAGSPELRATSDAGEWDVWVDEKIVGHLAQVGSRGHRRYDWEAVDGTVGRTISSDKAVAHVLDALIKFRARQSEE